jgi:hypothetical protein
MSFEWIVIFKELPMLIKDLGGLTNRSRATKNLLLSELKNNLKQFENAKRIGLTYEELIKILSNEQIVEARKKGFVFSLIKFGKIQDKHIKDKRNNRYKGKDCDWLFVSICDKINELKQLQTQRSLSNLKELNIGRQLSNLLYKMKLLTQFINS